MPALWSPSCARRSPEDRGEWRPRPPRDQLRRINPRAAATGVRRAAEARAWPQALTLRGATEWALLLGGATTARSSPSISSRIRRWAAPDAGRQVAGAGAAHPAAVRAATVHGHGHRAAGEADRVRPSRHGVVVQVRAGDDHEVGTVHGHGVADARHAAGRQAEDVDPGAARRTARARADTGRPGPARHAWRRRTRLTPASPEAATDGWRGAASPPPSARRTPRPPTRCRSGAGSRRGWGGAPPPPSAPPFAGPGPPRWRRRRVRPRRRRGRRRASSRPPPGLLARGKRRRRSKGPPGGRRAAPRSRRA